MFGDASGEGVCAAVYTVARKPSGVTRELLAAKARLAKKGLTIPRLELVACHMVTNLVNNTSRALCHIPHEKHCWSDSTVALWWITGESEYKQFVANRVAKIQDAKGIEWHHVPTTENPADLRSRGGQLTKLGLKVLLGCQIVVIGHRTSLSNHLPILRVNPKQRERFSMLFFLFFLFI